MVTVKHSFYKGKEVSFKPEYDECKKVLICSPKNDYYNDFTKKKFTSLFGN